MNRKKKKKKKKTLFDSCRGSKSFFCLCNQHQSLPVPPSILANELDQKLSHNPQMPQIHPYSDQ